MVTLMNTAGVGLECKIACYTYSLMHDGIGLANIPSSLCEPLSLLFFYYALPFEILGGCASCLFLGGTEVPQPPFLPTAYIYTYFMYSNHHGLYSLAL